MNVSVFTETPVKKYRDTNTLVMSHISDITTHYRKKGENNPVMHFLDTPVTLRVKEARQLRQLSCQFFKLLSR